MKHQRVQSKSFFSGDASADRFHLRFALMYSYSSLIYLCPFEPVFSFFTNWLLLLILFHRFLRRLRRSFWGISYALNLQMIKSSDETLEVQQLLPYDNNSQGSISEILTFKCFKVSQEQTNHPRSSLWPISSEVLLEWSWFTSFTLIPTGPDRFKVHLRRMKVLFYYSKCILLWQELEITETTEFKKLDRLLQILRSQHKCWCVGCVY